MTTTMRSLLVFTLLFIHSTWSQEVDEDFIGWHEEVGIKYAEYIRQSEESPARIVGGAVAPVHAHPYLAGLLINVIGLTAPSACGGSLLTSTRVLTAAHCWYDGRFQARHITVVLGSAFLFHGGFRVFASHIAVHPQYSARTFANDIAMLYLPVPAPISDAIRPITLPSGALLNMDYDGIWAQASGYGRYSDVINPTTNTMTRNVWLEVMPVKKCRSFYGKLVLDSNVCTHGVGGVGICQGDSGGPLTINVLGQDVLIGVSSFVALEGCELGYPSAFARVTSFIDWIQMHL